VEAARRRARGRPGRTDRVKIPTCFELRAVHNVRDYELCPEDCPQLNAPPMRIPCRRWSLNFKDQAGLSMPLNEYEKPSQAVTPEGHGPPRDE